MFVDDETGDFLLQGWTVTDPDMLADIARRSPIADNESVVRLPARMRAIIQEAANGHGATVQRTLVRAHIVRGIRFQRARVVSEPLAPFIRYEHAMTSGTNIAAGEDVRWLPRRLSSDLCLPANDYWLFDDRLIRFHYFSGDGDIVEDELVSDPAVIRMCAMAFAAVWERAIPHADYRPV